MKNIFLVGVIMMSQQAFAQTADAVKQETSITAKVQNIKLYGDVRYRYDFKDFENQAPETTEVQALRARLGVSALIADKTKFDFRLATGTGRTSTNQTLGGNTTAGTNYTINVDRATLGLDANEKLGFTLGRMGNPFVIAGGSDLAWDADLNFDGVSAKWTPKFGDLETTASLSRFALRIEGATASPVNLNTAGFAVKSNIGEDKNILGHVNFYQYEKLKDQAALVSGNLSGNLAGTGTNYANDYGILDVGLEFGFKVASQSFAIYGNYAQNTTTSDDNVAYLAGFKVNKLKKKGDWTFVYDYRVLERSSVIGAFTDGESFGGGVNGNNHRVSVGYQFGDAWYGSIAGHMGESKIATGETSEDRVRVIADIGASF